jgi:hypothetical protein
MPDTATFWINQASGTASSALNLLQDLSQTMEEEEEQVVLKRAIYVLSKTFFIFFTRINQ